MKIFCWNINSLAPTARNAVLRWGSFKALFEEYQVDVAAFQETKVRDDKLNKELCCVDGYQSFWAVSQERKGYSGVVTYASTSFAPLTCEADCLGCGEEDLDREGRVVCTDHGAFVLVNVYVPNAGDQPARARLGAKVRFLRALKAKCDGLMEQGREVIIAGDFNVAASPKDVHPTFKYDELYTEEERGAMLALLGSYTDIWRRLHPDATDVFTVWDEYTGARAFNRGLRIDYFLLTPGLLERVVSCEVVPTHPKWSDHTGLVLELRHVPPVPPHPPCQEWTKLLRRFCDTSQRSVAAMFGRKQQPKEQQQRAVGCGSSTAAATSAAPPQQPAATHIVQIEGEAAAAAAPVAAAASVPPLLREGLEVPSRAAEQEQAMEGGGGTQLPSAGGSPQAWEGAGAGGALDAAAHNGEGPPEEQQGGGAARLSGHKPSRGGPAMGSGGKKRKAAGPAAGKADSKQAKSGHRSIASFFNPSQS